MTYPQFRPTGKRRGVTVAQASAETNGDHCPSGTEFPCRPMPHTKLRCRSGKVYAKCSKCNRVFILFDPLGHVRPDPTPHAPASQNAAQEAIPAPPDEA